MRLAKMGRSIPTGSGQVLRPYEPMRLAAVYGSKDPPLQEPQAEVCASKKRSAGGGGQIGLGGTGLVDDGGAD
jgi:hypothetical protein